MTEPTNAELAEKLDNYSLYAGLDGENLFTLAATRLRAGAGGMRDTALTLLAAEDARQEKLHDLLETIREQIRNEVAPEHRPAGLFDNIQNAVYAMRGRTRLMDDAAITDARITALQAEVNRLTKERQELIDGFDRLGAARNGITEQVWAILGGQDETRPGGCNLVGRVGELHARATTAEADLATARQQIERLREALEPFAEAADAYEPDEGDGASMAWQHDFRIGALRRARAALRESGE
jgi:chromosome segregation ATPase